MRCQPFMKTRFTGLLITLSAVGLATLWAQQGVTKPAEGTLMLEKKSYALKQALAYETIIDSEDAIAVVLSGQTISSEQLTKARSTEKENGDPDFKRPFLRLIFKKTGELKYWSAAAGSTMLGRRSGTAKGDLQMQDSRVVGKASASSNAGDMFPSSFDVRFETALLKANTSLPESSARKGGPAANVAPSVTGVFKGNGKEAKLTYVSAHWREPFDDKPSMVLVFTEKDHSKDKKPDDGAMFGRFGSALIISLHEDGQIYSCQVVHSAHKKQGFSSSGSIEAPEFTYADGKVEGALTTNGEVDALGEKWEVNIKFVAPLGETPKEFQVAKNSENEEKKAKADSDDDEDSPTSKSDKKSAQPAAQGLKARDLALTKDATEVEYKTLVEQLGFKSKSDVKKACAELAANLKAQGWTNDGSDMVNSQSSILKRIRGEATLTIFVKPADGGSEVKMMTEGLSWTE